MKVCFPGVTITELRAAAIEGQPLSDSLAACPVRFGRRSEPIELTEMSPTDSARTRGGWPIQMESVSTWDGRWAWYDLYLS